MHLRNRTNMALEIKRFTVNMFGVNTYVVHDPVSRQAMLVDPGMISDSEHRMIEDYIHSCGLNVRYVINTHLHLDHAFGNVRTAKDYAVTPMAHAADRELGEALPSQARMFGIPGDFTPVDNFRAIDDSDILTLGNETVEILHTPGHTPGGIALYAPGSGWVITGDTLFQGSIGRTDLPGGDYSRLIDSVTTQLLSLPDSTMVYPGHGPSTTIGYEKSHNPYV